MNTLSLKLNAQSPEHLDNLMTGILNIASIICGNGYLPTDVERVNADLGRVWVWQDNNTVDLNPITANYKAFVQARAKNSITFRFQYRHEDVANLSKFMTILLNARFSGETEIVEH